MIQIRYLLLFMAVNCQAGTLNFHAVDQSKAIYRGGQPTSDQWSYLKSIGVSNVIKLDTKCEASDSCAVKLGMTVHEHSVNLWRQIFGPVKGIRQAALEITPGTYIHCKHGQDRTGETIATYRVLVDGWSKPKAEKEMLQLGFHKCLFGLWADWHKLSPLKAR